MTQQNAHKTPQPITWPILLVFGVGLLAIGLLIGFIFTSFAGGKEDAHDDVVEHGEVAPSAGSDVRAGYGTPSAKYGVEGDLFLNVANGDVYLRDADQWSIEGNLAEAAYENLMGPKGETGKTGDSGKAGQAGTQGPQGPAGPAGPVGPQGAAGANGEDGTIVKLGNVAPTGPCANNDDIFLNVKDGVFYTCADTVWEEFKTTAP